MTLDEFFNEVFKTGTVIIVQVLAAIFIPSGVGWFIAKNNKPDLSFLDYLKKVKNVLKYTWPLLFLIPPFAYGNEGYINAKLWISCILICTIGYCFVIVFYITRKKAKGIKGAKEGESNDQGAGRKLSGPTIVIGKLFDFSGKRTKINNRHGTINGPLITGDGNITKNEVPPPSGNDATSL